MSPSESRWPFDPWLAGWLATDVACVGHGPPWLWAQRRSLRLQALGVAAAAGSSWWRERLHDALAASRRAAGPTASDGAMAGVPSWWRHVPPLRRDELMRHFDQAVTDPPLRLACARRFAWTTRRQAGPYLGRFAVRDSSGSTVEPALFVHDHLSLAVSEGVSQMFQFASLVARIRASVSHSQVIGAQSERS